jgi:hypothetical protein
VPSSRRAAALTYFSLLANVILFFHKPLFSTAYLLPWDFRAVQLPLISFLVDRLREGHFALWNPYSYCGYPVFANIEACYFQPFVLAAAWIAAHTNPEYLPQLLEWVIALHICAAGIFSYHLFRNLGAARIPAWAGALIFETGGFFASRAEHIGAIMAVTFMPLAWLCVWKLRLKWNRRWFGVLAAALGMAMLGGFPQPTLAVYLSTTLLTLALLAFKLARRVVLFATAGACVLGVALAAVIFFPTAQLTSHSVALYRAGWLGAGGGIPWQSFVSLILPNHYRIFNPDFSGPGDRTFLYLYCSILGLAFALFAVALRRTRVVALITFMALFGGAFSLGENTPVWRAIYPLLPDRIRIVIHPEYCYCIFTLALAALAALGLDRLRARDAAKIAIGCIIALDLFLTGSGRPMNLIAVRDEPGVTRHAFDGSPDALATMRRLTYTADPPWRIDNMEGASLDWPVQAPLTRVPSADGVSPLALENIIQLRLFLHDGDPWGWYYPVAHPDSPVLGLLNVRYITATADAAARLAADPRFRFAVALPAEQVFENTRVLPRFFLVHDVRSAQSLAQARALINSGLDLSTTAVANVPLPPSAPIAPESVRTISYTPDSLELETAASTPALLVLSENDYPGWRAWLDGRPAPIYTADIAFRSLIVPPGVHRVTMRFEPSILWWSMALSGLTTLVIGGLITTSVRL